MIFVALAEIVTGNRRVIHRRDANPKRNRVRHCSEVIDPVDGHLVHNSIPIGDRREGVTPVRIDRQSALATDEYRVAGDVERGVTRDREAMNEDVVAFHVEGIMQDVT